MKLRHCSRCDPKLRNSKKQIEKQQMITLNFRQIFDELKHHIPFTSLGAVTGIVLMLLMHNVSAVVVKNLFYIFHPTHVLLSALVTASMYRTHTSSKVNILMLLIIGYTGSIGIATLSDSVLPYLGEIILKLPNRHAHIGILEKPVLVSVMAIVGVIIAYFNPATKFPHAGHVLISTWASLFHIMMAMGGTAGLFVYISILIFLFFAVWIPCCISDIVFPLLFIRGNSQTS